VGRVGDHDGKPELSGDSLQVYKLETDDTRRLSKPKRDCRGKVGDFGCQVGTVGRAKGIETLLGKLRAQFIRLDKVSTHSPEHTCTSSMFVHHVTKQGRRSNTPTRNPHSLKRFASMPEPGLLNLSALRDLPRVGSRTASPALRAALMSRYTNASRGVGLSVAYE
jgi:hypothetical protein